MKETIKSIKWSLILASLLYLVLGVALIFWPDASNLVLCYFIAVVLTAYGAFNILAFFGREGGSWIGLIVGIICAAFGIYALLQPTRINDIISLILGLVILVDGAMSLRRDFELRALGFEKWWVPLLLDMAILVFGILVIFNPTLFAAVLLQVIGAVLIYESLSDLWTIHRLSRLAKAAKQVVEEALQDSAAVEAEVVDVEDTEDHT